MDRALDLELNLGRGRPRKGTVVAVVRELEEEDLPKLAKAGRGNGGEMKKLRERHHALARCLADGMCNNEAALAVGYSTGNVNRLMDDPTFQELIRFYRSEKHEKYLDMHELLGALGKDVVMELLDRIENDAGNISIKELREIAQFASDRSGYGPTNKQEVSHTVNFGERLEAARRRMLDITPKED